MLLPLPKPGSFIHAKVNGCIEGRVKKHKPRSRFEKRGFDLMLHVPPDQKRLKAKGAGLKEK